MPCEDWDPDECSESLAVRLIVRAAAIRIEVRLLGQTRGWPRESDVMLPEVACRVRSDCEALAFEIEGFIGSDVSRAWAVRVRRGAEDMGRRR